MHAKPTFVRQRVRPQKTNGNGANWYTHGVFHSKRFCMGGWLGGAMAFQRTKAGLVASETAPARRPVLNREAATVSKMVDGD